MMKTNFYLRICCAILFLTTFVSTSVEAQWGRNYRRDLASVNPNPSTIGDPLTLSVRGDSADVYTLSITDNADTTGAVIVSQTVIGGDNALPPFAIGSYSFTLVAVGDTTGSIADRGYFVVRAPRVSAYVSPRYSTVGDAVSIRVYADSTESFTMTISDASGAAVQTLTVTGGTTALPALPVGNYSYALVDANGYTVNSGRFAVRAPRVSAYVSPRSSTVGDAVSIRVYADSTESFTMTISDTSGAAVQTLTVNGGTTALPALPVGEFTYALVDANGYTVNTGRFEVRAPRVSAYVSPRSSTVGDAISIRVFADSTESFTMTISDTSGATVQTLTVNGGTTALPALPVGDYSYALVDANGYTVNTGRFEVNAPRVSAYVTPRSSTVGSTASIRVFADSTESFTMTISDENGAVVQTLTVNGGTTALPALPVGDYTYTLVDANGYIVNRGSFEVEAPRVRSYVQPNPSHVGDIVSVTVRADSAASFTMNIYTADSLATLVQTLTVNGGSTALPALASGFYVYELIDADGYTVDRGRIVVLPPNVSTLIAPNPSAPGEGSITVDADVTETFTLNIYDSSNMLISSTSVTGGTTLLPALTSGIYYYAVINSTGDRVSRGRILITN